LTHLVPKTLAAAAGLALTVGAVLTVPAAATAGTSAISLHRIKVGGMPDQVTIDHQTRSVWVAAGRLVRISEVTRRVTASITIRPGVRLVAADPKTRTVGPRPASLRARSSLSARPRTGWRTASAASRTRPASEWTRGGDLCGSPPSAR